MARFPQLRLTQPVETNQLFIAMPRTVIARLSERYFFYVWNEAADEVRFVTHGILPTRILTRWWMRWPKSWSDAFGSGACPIAAEKHRQRAGYIFR